jgi:hypothetical protein
MPEGVFEPIDRAQRLELVRLFDTIERAVDFCYTVWELLGGYIASCRVSEGLVRQAVVQLDVIRAGVQLDAIRDALDRARVVIGLPRVLRRHHPPIAV